MRLLSLLCVLLLTVPVLAVVPDEAEAARAAVAVELAILALKNKKVEPKTPIAPIPKPKPDLPTDPNQPAPVGWQWIKYGDGPWRLVPIVETPKAAPGVAAPTFQRAGQDAGYNKSHVCPSCGRSQYIVDRFNSDGSHQHRCASCGTTWRHRRRKTVPRPVDASDKIPVGITVV